MSNQLRIFKNEQFGEIRTIQKDGEPWFVGKDVAKILGFSNSRDAILTHVFPEDKNDRYQTIHANFNIF